MSVYHQSAVALAALLIAAAPASATLITPSALQIAGEVALQINSSTLEFDVEDWASFINSGAPEYQLSELGSGIAVFGEPDQIQPPPPRQFGDDRMLSQIWERP